MPKRITLTLPYPPSVNRYWRHNRGRTHLSKEAQEYRQEVDDAVLELPYTIRKTLPLEERLSVTMYLYPPDRRRHDIDNRVKGVFDSLEAAGVMVDDEQIDRLNVIRMPVERGGCLEVEIEEL